MFYWQFNQMIFLCSRIMIAGMSVLHIAQKNSIAKQVANILSHSQKRYVPSISDYNPIYEFKLEQKMHKFSSVRGHIFTYQLPQQWKNWKASDNKKILLSQVPMVKTWNKDMNNVIKNLQILAKNSEELILWLDCDRQGQAIAFEVIQICTKVNPQLKIKRARFNAVTESDVWKAYSSLGAPNQLESDAVNYRIQIDFRSGCSFTRFQTVTFQSFFQMKLGSFLSYGPCQIPTLSFVVQRYLQIKNFKPEKFWSLQMNCVIDEKTKIPFTWEKKNTKNQEQAYQIMNKILTFFPNGKVIGTVTQRNRIEKKKYRPYPLTTVQFQKLATNKLKMSSNQAMEIAEKLYQMGIISYPRTETNSFPKTMDLKFLIKRLQSSKNFGNYVEKLLNGKYFPPKSGNKSDQAHTPIHPVKMVNEYELDSKHWKVYELIVRSFLACCSADAIGQQYQVKAEIAGQVFKASYLTIRDKNYLEVYPYENWIETNPPSDIPHEFNVIVGVKEGKTVPPGYLTESQLIDLMEKNQIGTDSTIHQHIQIIKSRQYAIKSHNTFKPTNLGAALVQTYQQLQINLPKCDIRRKIEQKMNMITKGTLSKNDATSETLHQMISIYQKLNGMKEQWAQTMKKYMESNSELKRIQINEREYSEPKSTNRPRIEVCKCQFCGSIAQAIYSEKIGSYFLGCSKYPICKWSHFLPRFISQIKATQKSCNKCESGKIVKITAKEAKPITSLQLKERFSEAPEGKIQICLNPLCNLEIYQDTPKNENKNANNTQISIIIKRNDQQKTKQKKFENEMKSQKQKQVQKEQNKKVCKQCGVIGRHPKGTTCPAVAKKRKKIEQENNNSQAQNN